MDEEWAKKGLEDDIRELKKLDAINKSAEFNDYFDHILRTVSEKMVHIFTGDSIKTWEDYLKARGEITAYLYPIQEVRGANAMAKNLKERLDEFYKNPYDA